MHIPKKWTHAKLMMFINKVLARMYSRREDIYYDLKACNEKCGGAQAFSAPMIFECAPPKKGEAACHLYLENLEYRYINRILELLASGAFTSEQAVAAFLPLYAEQEAHIH